MECLNEQVLREIQNLLGMIGNGFLSSHRGIEVQSLLDTKVPCQVSRSLDDKLDTFQIEAAYYTQYFSQGRRNEPQEAKGAETLY